MPVKFRDAMRGGCVITKGQDRCLVLYDLQGWESYVAQLRSLSQMDQRVRAFARSIFGSASDVVPDSQGRVLVTPKLREYAGIDKDVVIAGVDDHIEIWDAERWDSVTQEADEHLLEVSQSLAELQRGR